MNRMQAVLDEKGWFSEGGPDEDVVLSSRARIVRNLSGYVFPYKLSENEVSQVQDSVRQAFNKIKPEKEIQTVTLEDLSVIERRKLIERHFVSQDYSLEKDRLVVFDTANLLSAVVNVRNHLQMAAFAGGFDLEKAYERVSSVEHLLEQYLDFSVSLDKGYLSADIKNCGTGLQASLLLHLPALEYSSMIERAFKKVMDSGYDIKGYTGEDEGSLGALYELYNPVAIGQSEKELLQKLAYIASQLVDYERRAREEMKRHRRVELEDIVYRALGTLKYCRIIEEKEAMQLLAKVRLGAVLGWLDISPVLINSLLILVGKAHIQQLISSGETADTTREIQRVRADFIQYALGFAADREVLDV